MNNNNNNDDDDNKHTTSTTHPKTQHPAHIGNIKSQFLPWYWHDEDDACFEQENRPIKMASSKRNCVHPKEENAVSQLQKTTTSRNWTNLPKHQQHRDRHKLIVFVALAIQPVILPQQLSLFS